jgi:hypothetical protein
MAGILGYARVSTGDQDVAGQTMRLKEAGAIKVFTDTSSRAKPWIGRDWRNCSSMPAPAIRLRSYAWIASVGN